jgi:acetyl-CoA acyltransferase
MIMNSRRPEAVIVDAVRSPMGKGKPGGALSNLHPVELLAQVLAALVERNRIDPGSVDDVLVGCVGQVGEQSATPGRQAWLAAGFPAHVPSVTVERKCGSGQQAIDFAVQGVMAGAYDLVIAGGVESMSRVPLGSPRIGKDPHGPAVSARYAPGLVPQGVSAELVAARWNLSREELDAFSARSHQRAAAARDAGQFESEIVPIRVPTDSGECVLVAADETIRPDTSVERLAQLQPAFASPAYTARFPDIEWKITAGNSSQITDGASAVLVMSAERAAAEGLRPRARIVASAVCGDDPLLMLTGPIPATRKVLARGGFGLDDIDLFEVNEAFASVPLAWQADLGVDARRLNVRGGAVALGHPLGASGSRLLTTLLNALEASGGRYGLQTMCEAGGMANAFIVERI